MGSKERNGDQNPGATIVNLNNKRVQKGEDKDVGAEVGKGAVQ